MSIDFYIDGTKQPNLCCSTRSAYILLDLLGIEDDEFGLCYGQIAVFALDSKIRRARKILSKKGDFVSPRTFIGSKGAVITDHGVSVKQMSGHLDDLQSLVDHARSLGVQLLKWA